MAKPGLTPRFCPPHDSVRGKNKKSTLVPNWFLCYSVPMTKQHFERIADILKGYIIINPALGFDDGWSSAAEGIANELADYFEATNDRFNRERFLTACGL